MWIELGLACTVATFAVGSAAHAELLPIRANAFAGAGYNNESTSGNISGGGISLSASGSSANAGLELGGDVGLPLGDFISIVALAEYQPIFSSPSTSLVTVGGGVRLGIPFIQLLLGAGYSSFHQGGSSVTTPFGTASGGGSSTGGYTLKAFAFLPVILGVGPYASAGYSTFSPASGFSSHVLSLNGGLSFSY